MCIHPQRPPNNSYYKEFGLGHVLSICPSVRSLANYLLRIDIIFLSSRILWETLVRSTSVNSRNNLRVQSPGLDTTQPSIFNSCCRVINVFVSGKNPSLRLGVYYLGYICWAEAREQHLVKALVPSFLDLPSWEAPHLTLRDDVVGQRNWTSIPIHYSLL